MSELCDMLFCALTLTFASAAACQHHAPAEKGSERPDELFRSRCLACHVPPDPRFAVERAWLEQVLDTA